MQLENINKNDEDNIPEDSHVIHFLAPCKFEIDENYDFVSDNFLFNTFSNLLYCIAYPLLLFINKFFFNFKIEGKENMENIDCGKVTVSNHVHPMDCTMVGLGNIPSKTFFTSLETNFKIPLVRRIIKLLNTIPIPQDIKYTKNFMKAIDELLQKNKTVHFYPEGSLWPYYPKIRNFKNGAFDFAVRNNVPVVPMVFKFSKQPKCFSFLKSKTNITLSILPPFYPNHLLDKRERTLDLKNRVHEAMVAEVSKEN